MMLARTAGPQGLSRSRSLLACQEHLIQQLTVLHYILHDYAVANQR
jgi:hypothetical protein